MRIQKHIKYPKICQVVICEVIQSIENCNPKAFYDLFSFMALLRLRDFMSENYILAHSFLLVRLELQQIEK